MAESAGIIVIVVPGPARPGALSSDQHVDRLDLLPCASSDLSSNPIGGCLSWQRLRSSARE